MTDAPAIGVAEYRTRSSTHAVVLDDEVLIWDAVGVQLHRLNGPASCIWQELAQWRSSAEVVDQLADAISVDSARLRVDVDDCIASLFRSGLVDRRSRADNT
jgi:hypothetical protein